MKETPIFKHIAAFVYDIFPVVGILLLTSFVTLIIRNGQEVARNTIWFDVLLFCEVAFYYVYSWKIGGQTLGMRAWKMKIIPNDKNQATLTWTQALVRFLVGIVSCFGGIGIFWKVITKDKTTWMDKVSNSKTLIVEESSGLFG